MCHGTYVQSFTCGHVLSTPDTCLRSIDPHYRCEPLGMKITQPVGRCVECYARNLNPSGEELGLATSVRFNPYPMGVVEGRGKSGSAQVRAILKWVGNVKSLRSLGSRSFGELRKGSESSSEGSTGKSDGGSMNSGGVDDR